MLGYSRVNRGAAEQLFIGGMWEIPGIFLGCFLGMMYPRITSAKFYLTLLAVVLLLFVIGGNNRNRHWAFDICLYAGYYGTKMTPQIGFVILYQANEDGQTTCLERSRYVIYVSDASMHAVANMCVASMRVL